MEHVLLQILYCTNANNRSDLILTMLHDGRSWTWRRCPGAPTLKGWGREGWRSEGWRSEGWRSEGCDHRRTGAQAPGTDPPCLHKGCNTVCVEFSFLGHRFFRSIILHQCSPEDKLSLHQSFNGSMRASGRAGMLVVQFLRIMAVQ